MQDLKFNIIKTTVEAKSRVIKCKCGKETGTYLTARLDEPSNRINIRCDDCREDGDLDFSFSEPEVQSTYGLDIEKEIYDSLAQAIKEEIQAEEFATRRSFPSMTFEERYLQLLKEAQDDEQHSTR